MNLDKFKQRFVKKRVELSLVDFLEKAKTDSSLLLSASERILKAVGEPKIVDTAQDSRLGRIFGNRLLRIYEPFKDFYGLELVVEQIMSFFQHASQGMEEKKQILYLVGSVGGGKSSLAERLKELMETQPFYALATEKEISPIFESPLGLFKKEDAKELEIPARYFEVKPSPWALKRLDEFGGDLTKFKVVKLFPNQDRQIGICKVEPGDDNNQDISSLVGKLDIRKLETFSQDDVDAYRFSGGLCLGNRGILEYVEMFKAPLKTLHPLLTATQEGNFKGTESLPAIPFEGIVLAHSNESEWKIFKNNTKNEAFIDRIYTIKVPYNLRFSEEEKIYKKMINNSALTKAPLAPHTLKALAMFSVLTSLDLEKSTSKTCEVKLRVYDGDNLKDRYVTAKSYSEYRSLANEDEGFKGISVRTAYKILAKVFNYDIKEVGANPIHLLLVLVEFVEQEDLDSYVKDTYLNYINDVLKPFVFEKIGKDIQYSCLKSSEEYGQNIFDRYITYADFWLQENDYRDPDTGQLLDNEALDTYLIQIEHEAGIGNKDAFRSEIVNFSLRYKARKKGENLKWTKFGKIREVIEKHIFKNIESILPQLSFERRHLKEKDNKETVITFLKNMKKKGYTQQQAKLAVEWFQRYSKTK